MSSIPVPIKKFSGDYWGDLCSFGTHSVEIVGEVVHKRNDNFPFIQGHRVRLFKFKKNVHFKVPAGTDIDISGVQPGKSPTRRQWSQMIPPGGI